MNKLKQIFTNVSRMFQSIGQKGKERLARGKVKWFNNQKGYGFLVPEGEQGPKEIFVHYSVIQGEGYKTLKEGDMVSFEIVNSGKGEQARNVVRLPA